LDTPLYLGVSLLLGPLFPVYNKPRLCLISLKRILESFFFLPFFGVDILTLTLMGGFLMIWHSG